MALPLALLGAVPAVFQGIMGLQQMNAAKKGLNSLQRPVYDIPDATKQSLALASQAYADPRMPGESQAYSQIGQTMSNYLRAGRDSGNPLAGLAMAQANTNRANQQVQVASAQNQEQDRRVLMDNMANYAKYQDQEFQYNKHAPYADKYNEYREQYGAGRQNTFNALNSLSSVGMQFLAGQGKPVDSGTIADARSNASTAQNQDSFITAAGKLAGGVANDAYKAAQQQYPGMTPAQLMTMYQQIRRL